MEGNKGEWHNEWQSHFNEIKEIKFKKINSEQFKDRSADVFIDENDLVIEFEHSPIKLEEVNERNHDYHLNDKNIIWVVDCDDAQFIYNDDKCIINFNNGKRWKYKSFITCDYIFLDIQDMIFKINANLVVNDFIHVEKPIPKDLFIEYLRTNNKYIYEKPINLYQCNLTVIQKGAGNGKTYNIIQQLNCETFKKYTNIIIVTKQHSNKYIVNKEFIKQYEEKILNNIFISDDEFEKIKNGKNQENNKFYYYYKNLLSENMCSVIMGTMDSFIYASIKKRCDSFNRIDDKYDKFKENVEKIINDNDCNSLIKYGGDNIKLNNNICLICDEFQDLPKNYAEAILTLMNNKYIDVYIVGDLLQSISDENNAFKYFYETKDDDFHKDYPLIDKIIPKSENISIRFKDNSLIQFVNEMIPFTKYNIPSIEYNPESIDSESNVFVFKGNPIYENTETKVLNKEIEFIMDFYKKEVEKNNYKPNNFLFVTPCVRKNLLANMLQEKINIYWEKKYKDLDEYKYKSYCIFHTSEKGESIDLNESEELTRIVSIHTSKGDGREVVFVIGLNEKSLKCHTQQIKNSLKYDSLLHVALTRMKKTLYIRIENNYDDIFNKIKKYEIINPKFKIIENEIENSYLDCLFKINNYNYKNDLEKMYEIIYNTNPIINDFISRYKSLIILKKNSSKVLNKEYHNIRYYSMLCIVVFKIYNYYCVNKKYMFYNDNKHKFCCIIHNIIKSEIKICKTVKEYYKYLYKFKSYYDTEDIKTLKKIKIPIIENNELIMNNINNIQKNIQKYLISLNSINIKTVNDSKAITTEWYIVFTYIYNIINCGNYTDFHNHELYRIMNILMKKNDENEKDLKIHFELLEKFDVEFGNFVNNDGSLYYYNHTIYNNKLKILNRIDLIKCNEITNTLDLVYFHPTVTDLNINDYLLDCLFDFHFIKNLTIDKGKSKLDNVINNIDKKIYIHIFSFNESEKIIDFNELWNDEINNVINDILKNLIIERYLELDTQVKSCISGEVKLQEVMKIKNNILKNFIIHVDKYTSYDIYIREMFEKIKI